MVFTCVEMGNRALALLPAEREREIQRERCLSVPSVDMLSMLGDSNATAGDSMGML